MTDPERPAPVPIKLPTLSYAWALRAATEGIRREVDDIYRGRKPIGLQDLLWIQDVEGAAAEASVAAWLKLPWTGRGSLENPDVLGFEVKWRNPYLREVLLCMNPHNADERRYILVTGSLRVGYKVLGWATGAEIRGRGRLRKDHRGPKVTTYFALPSALLNDMRLIPAAAKEISR